MITSTHHTRTIVVSESDPASRELLSEILKAEGYRVVEALDARDAFEQVEKLHPALLIIDIHMPLISGLDTIGRIKGDRRFPKLLVMAVTAHAMVGDRELILSRGFDGYVSKPIDAITFPQLIRDLLEAGAHA